MPVFKLWKGHIRHLFLSGSLDNPNRHIFNRMNFAFNKKSEFSKSALFTPCRLERNQVSGPAFSREATQRIDTETQIRPYQHSLLLSSATQQLQGVNQ